MQYNGLIPELYVSNFEESLVFYCEWLYFKLEYARSERKFAFLSFDASQLMLQQREPSDNHSGPLDYPYGRGVNLQIQVPDVEAVAKVLNEHDYPARSPVQEKWRQISEIELVGSRELKVLDPDGYYLRFAQELGFKPKSP